MLDVSSTTVMLSFSQFQCCTGGCNEHYMLNYVVRNELCLSPATQLPIQQTTSGEKRFKLNCLHSNLYLGELTMSCRAFSPLTVTKHEIFSFLLIAKVRTVYRALPYTGCCPVSCSSTCIAATPSVLNLQRGKLVLLHALTGHLASL